MNYSSIVDYMKSLGVDSSFSSRKELYESIFKSPYSGSSDQNTTLMQFIQKNYGKDTTISGQINNMGEEMAGNLFNTEFPLQRKSEKLKKYIEAVNQLAMRNPRDPMLPQYQQFIRKEINRMEESTNNLAKMIK